MEESESRRGHGAKAPSGIEASSQRREPPACLDDCADDVRAEAPGDHFFFAGLPSSPSRRVASVVFFPSITASIHANTSFISEGGVEWPALCSRTITS